MHQPNREAENGVSVTLQKKIQTTEEAKYEGVKVACHHI